MSTFKFQPISSEQFLTQTEGWASTLSNQPQSGSSASPIQTSDQIIFPTNPSTFNPPEAVGSFNSPDIQTNTASAQLESGSFLRTQTLMRTLTKNVNLSLQPESGYIPRVEYTDVEPDNVPETAKEKWDSLSAQIKMADKLKKKKKGKSVKIQTFLNATRDYISSGFAPKKEKSKEAADKVNKQERRPRGSIKAKSVNDIDSPETDVGSEMDHKDQARMKQIASTLSIKSVHDLDRARTVILDIPEENFPAGISQTSLSSDALPSLPGVTRQATNITNKQRADDTIFEIEPENEMSPNVPGIRRTKPLNNINVNALVAEGLVMAVLPTEPVKPNKKGKKEKAKENITNDGRQNAAVTVTINNKKKSTAVGSRNRFINGFRLFSIGFGIFVLTYVVFPLVVMFGAHDYENYLVRAVLNFGLIGILAGITQVVLIYYSVDVPLKKRISQIEGANKGLFQASKYLILNKSMVSAILLVNFAIQIGVGFLLYQQEIEPDALAVVIGSLCVVIITNLIWSLIVSILNPKQQKDEKKILNKEIQHIEEARKDFLNELQTTRNFLDERENLQYTARSYHHGSKMSISMNTLLTERPFLPDSTRGTMIKIKDTPDSRRGTVNRIEIPDSTRGTMTKLNKEKEDVYMNYDTRKLQNKAYDHSKEFKAMRVKCMRALLILVFALVELLIMTQIVEALHKTPALAMKLVLVAVVAFIGVTFGIVNPITWARIPKLTMMKIASIVVAGGVYRYLFLDLSSSTALICAAAVKFGFKFLTITLNSILGKVFYKYFGSKPTNKELDILHYTRPEEKDQMNIRFPKYLLHKGVISQEVDIFFTLVAITAFVYNKSIASSVNVNFDAYVNPLTIYPWILLIELAIDVVIMGVYMVLGERILKKKVTVLKINVMKESWKGLMKRKWALLSFKALTLFILYLSRSVV